MYDLNFIQILTFSYNMLSKPTNSLNRLNLQTQQGNRENT